MRPRFQADADFTGRILAGLRRREPSIDFQSANDGGLIGEPDPTVLALAASQGRSNQLRTTPHGHYPIHTRCIDAAPLCPGMSRAASRPNEVRNSRGLLVANRRHRIRPHRTSRRPVGRGDSADHDHQPRTHHRPVIHSGYPRNRRADQCHPRP